MKETNMVKTLKGNKGVTLLELLAVLVILGIVAAIAIPTIGNLIENQQEKAVHAEWTQILSAAELYILDDQATFNEDGEFSLQDLIDNNYLSNMESDIRVHVNVIFSTIIINDYSLIMFDKDTGNLSESKNYSGVEINGFFVEGSPAPVRPDNRL
jgi:prepilin-type N-terminal cleavage/methylation domain-containing protein